MMTEAEVRQLLVDTKAVLEGHFLLTSGLHSPLYVEKFNVLQHPEYTERIITGYNFTRTACGMYNRFSIRNNRKPFFL